MKLYSAQIESTSRTGFGKHHDIPKLEREGAEDYDARTYLGKLHTIGGKVAIPGTMFHLSLRGAAKYLGMQIPGKGKSTYTKLIERGMIFHEPLVLDMKPEDVTKEVVFTSLTPTKPNSGRGNRYFPVVEEWSGVLQFFVLDDMLKSDVIEKHFLIAGQMTGIGVWRPSSPGGPGLWGKFRVVSMEEKPIL